MVHNRDFVTNFGVQFHIRRASTLIWHNLSHPCYDLFFWREKWKLCQAMGLHTPSRLVFSLSSPPAPPPPGHLIFPFTVSGTQLSFRSLPYKAEMFLAKHPSFTLNFVHTPHVLCVVFYFYSNALLLLFSAISWFSPFIVPFLNIPTLIWH